MRPISFLPRRRRGSALHGFSLVELLIALTVFGLVAVLGAWQVGRSMRRARLDSAAADVQSIALRAVNETRGSGHATFLRLELVPASGSQPANWRATLWLDADTTAAPSPTTVDNGALDDPGDTLLQTLDLPSDIAFSTKSTTKMTTENWSVNTDDNVTRLVSCDALGRTIIPGTPATKLSPGTPSTPLRAAATLEMTHRDMVMPTTTLPSLQPPVRYQLRIGPVWSVSLDKQVYMNSAWSKP
jgi:prepilin-type N-terminal cleavage/methylation domain-containing protein